MVLAENTRIIIGRERWPLPYTNFTVPHMFILLYRELHNLYK